MKNTLLYSAAALIATSAAANAQSIDYQVMGDMFGEPVTTGATGAPDRGVSCSWKGSGFAASAPRAFRSALATTPSAAAPHTQLCERRTTTTRLSRCARLCVSAGAPIARNPREPPPSHPATRARALTPT